MIQLVPSAPWRAIAAMSENRVIGNGPDIPWRISEDFKWFKAKTMGGILVMGRKTWDSIGRPLPGRATAVVSRSQPKLPNGVDLLPSLDAIDSRNYRAPIWICGGGEIYRQALPRCQELFLTLVKRQVEGDAFFPEFEDQFELKETLRDESEFQIRHYVRK
ncbi:MAG: dihydrofolate reductase [Opitutales bacterium TMED158]|nr:MAG: dihydrofolate reductase [Opitutales bacterium TMED158]